jgi:DNA-binding NtrC family response regulator
MPHTVLVVDDQARARRALAAELEDAGFQVLEAGDGEEAWDCFQNERPDLVITDMVMPRADGLELLSRVRSRSETPVLIFTAYGSVESAVSALKGGAQEFVVSPDVEVEDLVEFVRSALAHRETSDRGRELELRLVGSGRSISRVRERIAGLAPLRTPVLVTGEPGSGRSTVVKALHELGSSSGTALSCIDTVSFRPAHTIPNSGAVHLDGLDRLTPEAQAHWAVLIESFENSQKAPRVFASTSAPIAAAAARGHFDQDLAAQLLRFEVTIPPLRRRSEDIPAIARALVQRIGAAVGRPKIRLSTPALDFLSHLRWPENVRQLERALERAIAYSRGPQIQRRILEDVLSELEQSLASIREQHTDLERRSLIDTINQTGGNITQTAAILGKSRSAIYRLIAKHGIPLERPD